MKNKMTLFWITTVLFAVIYSLVQNRREIAKQDEWVQQGGGVITDLPDMGKVPDFKIPDLQGNVITPNSLKGKIWVLNLNYSNCETPCHLMSHNMSQLQRFFKVGDFVRLVTITTDPDYDTVEVLKEYSKSFDADPKVWMFLRPEKSEIAHLAEGFKLPLDLVKKTHSTRFVLIDGDGVIRGYFDSLDKNKMETLRATITSLIKK